MRYTQLCGAFSAWSQFRHAYNSTFSCLSSFGYRMLLLRTAPPPTISASRVCELRRHNGLPMSPPHVFATTLQQTTSATHLSHLTALLHLDAFRPPRAGGAGGGLSGGFIKEAARTTPCRTSWSTWCATPHARPNHLRLLLTQLHVSDCLVREGVRQPVGWW